MPKLGSKPGATGAPPARTEAWTDEALAAFAAAGAGWPTFPVAPGTKDRPQVKAWQEAATTDLEQVRRWWRLTPHANPAIVPGRVGVMVVDLDRNHAEGVDGVAEWETLGLPDAPGATVRTPGTGFHGYLRIADGQPVPNSAGKIAPGVDVRSDRGYVLAPGARTADGVYTESHGRNLPRPEDLPPASAPLLALSRAPKGHGRPTETRPSAGLPSGTDAPRRNPEEPLGPGGVAAARERELRILRATRDGGRNNQTNASAYALGRIYGDHPDAEAVQAELRLAARETGLPEDELARAIASGWEAGHANPRTLIPTGPPRGQSAQDFLDGPLAVRVAEQLRPRYRWAGGRGWLAWDSRRWRECTEPELLERVRQSLEAEWQTESQNTADPGRVKAATALLGRGKMTAVAGLLRGMLEEDASRFDQQPDLLNVGNGVLDLATGALRPHNPDLLLTRVTEVDYKPNATSADWSAALRAVPEDVLPWLQTRVGQAATGYMTPDDVLPILQGTGSNGKSTVVAAIVAALGEHATVVPDKVLLANPTDHSTELTTLQGARFALIEETPETRHLSVARLKAVLGTPKITARRIAKDNITWDATHSLFLTTNYRPRIEESDHGTWRRLALVQFPYTFRAAREGASGEHDRVGDPGLRDRLRGNRGGDLTAVLAWVVEGARRWYAADRTLLPPPARVVTDTTAWRGESDVLLGFITEQVMFDPEARVLSTDLYRSFREYLERRGQRVWADQTFAARFADHEDVVRHGVQKQLSKSSAGLSRPPGGDPVPAGRATYWLGVAFPTEARTPGNATVTTLGEEW